MRLLGVEFRDYARFDRCFVPLDTGIRLLVGKNNSGKTSLLRALSALTALPFGKPAAFSTEVARYARKQVPLPNYEMEIVFAYEESDSDFLGADLGGWPKFAAASKRTWAFSFKVYPQSSSIVLVDASLQCDATALPIIEVGPNNYVRLFYDSRGAIAKRQGRAFESAGPQLSDGTLVRTFSEEDIFSEFPDLMSTRFVHAHRVVRPNLGLQALETLADTAESLAPFLDTALSNNRETFDKIQKVVTDTIPEFKFVNPEKAQNSVSITLTRRDTNEKVPLTHCGTGVEQVLALATFVLASGPGTIILLDEPHSYLHPTAERQVVDFLFSHTEHRYVISTHSAILINSVPPDRILVLGKSNTIGAPSSESSSVPTLLHSLGYKNSDLLFNDRLIFVEGESDQDILPLLLLCNPLLSRPDLEKTGFPVMDGEGRLRGRDQQTSLMYWEKFLIQLGKQSSPRVYLFDGDCALEDQKLLGKTKAFEAGSAALLRFLGMHEIENYLLVPEAIASAMEELANFQGENLKDANSEAVGKKLSEILCLKENRKLYPQGPPNDPNREVKGSVALQMLLANYGLRYEKRKV